MSSPSLQQLVSDSQKCIDNLSKNSSNPALWRALTGGLEEIADQMAENPALSRTKIDQIRSLFTSAIQLSRDRKVELESIFAADLKRFEQIVQTT